jgi:hypothetical protein
MTSPNQRDGIWESDNQNHIHSQQIR